MKHIFAIIFLFFVIGVQAQIDSSIKNQSVHNAIPNDSLNAKNGSSVTNNSPAVEHRIISERFIVSSIREKKTLKDNLIFCFPNWFYNKGVKQSPDLVRLHVESNAGDIFFYCILFIVLLVGLIRLFFPKYFHQVFQFILQPRVRRKNFRESNNAENIIPAILLNFIFVITSSLCVVQLTKKDFSIDSDWKFWLYYVVIITLIYLIKFFVIKISGWVFDASQAASTYNYVVFTINKILGVILIPVIILAVYGSSGFASIIYSASSIIIVGLLIYRYIASFILLRGNLRVSIFHFFIYLCAIEILPLLITYKVLLMNLEKII